MEGYGHSGTDFCDPTEEFRARISLWPRRNKTIWFFNSSLLAINVAEWVLCEEISGGVMDVQGFDDQSPQGGLCRH